MSTAKYRITLSDTCIQSLNSYCMKLLNKEEMLAISSSALDESRLTGEEIVMLKELLLAVIKVNAKAVMGVGAAYNTKGMRAVSSTLGHNPLTENNSPQLGYSPLKVKTESELLAEMSPENRAAAMKEMEAELMKQIFPEGI